MCKCERGVFINKRLLLIVLLFSFIWCRDVYASEMLRQSKIDKGIEEVNEAANYIPDYVDKEITIVKTRKKTKVVRECIGKFSITGYCPCSSCCGVNTGITASGAAARSNHTIAMSPSYSFGTEVIIDDNVYVCEDRGGAIRGNIIDMYFDSHSEALSWGRRYKDVYVEKEVEIEEEYEIKLRVVEFLEYVNITGYLFKVKKATSTYDKENNVTEWTNQAGNIVAKRYKDDNGVYIHYVEENIYKEWNQNR